LTGEEWASAKPLAPPISSQMPAVAPPRRDTPVAGVSVPPPVPAAVAGATAMNPSQRRRSTLKTFPTEPPPPTVVRPEPAEVERAPATIVAAPPEGIARRTSIAPVRPGQRHRGPLLLEDALAEAEEASDRDALLGLLFDFARQFFEYTALFLVHGDIAEGRDGFGNGATRERVRGIGVPLDMPSLLSRAREARIPIVAVPQADGLDAVLLSDLKRPRDAEMVVVPIVVRTRAVALLIGDCGDGGIDRDSLRPITELSSSISGAFERIIVRRKLEGFTAGGRSPSAGRIQAAAVPSKRLAPSNQETTPAPAPAPAPPLPQEFSPTPPDPVVSYHPLGLTRSRSSAPPLVNVATMRPIVGPPIPREEPDPESEPAPVAGSDSVVHADTGVDGLGSAGLEDQSAADFAHSNATAVGLLMKRFPGPVTLPRSQALAMSPPPPASECGPVLHLVARARKRALPYLLDLLSDDEPEKRGWATHLLYEMPYLEALPALVARLQDEDAVTRASAGHAMAAMTRAYGQAVVDALTRFGAGASPEQRAEALDAMGESGEPATVPELIRGLDDEDERVSAVAHRALVHVTRQDFGKDAPPWLEWWEQNADRHRVEWLIDALVHEGEEIRRAASEELRSQSRQYFGYSSDLPARDREHAQQRYRDWWITEGRSRHLRP
jgi:hypothetical protein